ncbi:DUF4396 domain-containing protein [Anaeromyxobacter sp. Red801]|uniref:DUF4396 domain-containing protein n=1 Tax=Anaeromyxobacter sp. Red801 TaxID=3411632 RepID=UPI003B9E9351
MSAFPGWLQLLSVVYLAASAASAVVVLVDIVVGNHRQSMWIMDVVWPVTALWSGPFGLYAYHRWGRAAEKRSVMRARQEHRPPPNRAQPFAVLAGKGATHCGSGCTLGDIIAELLILAVPFSIFGRNIFGAWAYDFVLAFAMGIAFQYFTIKPMRNLSVRDGLREALKADALSLVAWQLGMYGWMALATFVLLHHELSKASPVFWFMMQVAMFFGFLTSYPVNWFLIKRGVKEAM